MPRGDKRRYTDKQKRQAEHIEEGYKERGVSAKEAAARAWATVNAVHGGGEKPGGGGYGKSEDHAPMRKGGRNSHKGSSYRKPGGRKRAASTKRTASRKRTATKPTRSRTRKTTRKPTGRARKPTPRARKTTRKPTPRARKTTRKPTRRARKATRR